jgi:outer membrane lipoprotein carrier protein
MRLLFLLLLGSLTLIASPKELNSFHASFIQTITDEHKKKLIYTGELWASKPQNALWKYTKPVQKSVYISGSKLTLIEPSLEQATVRTLDNDIDFLEILKKSKPVNSTRYNATVAGETYNIDFTNGTLDSISYTDSYDNNVIIRFSNQVQNKPIEESRFKAIIPTNFDVIRN